MKTIATLRNIEFGKDPFALIPTPPSVERLARDFGHALDAMRAAMLGLLAAPDSESALDAVVASRDDLILAEGDLWDVIRCLPHRAFALQDGRYLWLSDTPAPQRPWIVLADADGNRQCPGCYGVGMYDARGVGSEPFRPCSVCRHTGILTVELPTCCRKDLAHVHD